jgi:hypothetical protein
MTAAATEDPWSSNAPSRSSHKTLVLPARSSEPRNSQMAPLVESAAGCARRTTRRYIAHRVGLALFDLEGVADAKRRQQHASYQVGFLLAHCTSSLR